MRICLAALVLVLSGCTGGTDPVARPATSGPAPSDTTSAPSPPPRPDVEERVADAARLVDGLPADNLAVNPAGDLLISWQYDQPGNVCHGPGTGAFTWIDAGGHATKTWLPDGEGRWVDTTPTGFVLGPSGCLPKKRRQEHVIAIDGRGRAHPFRRVRQRMSMPRASLHEFQWYPPSKEGSEYTVVADAARREFWILGPDFTPALGRHRTSFEAYDEHGTVWRQGYPTDPGYEQAPYELKHRAEWWPVGHLDQLHYHTVDYEPSRFIVHGRDVALVGRRLMDHSHDGGATWKTAALPRASGWDATTSGRLVSEDNEPQRSTNRSWTSFEAITLPSVFRYGVRVSGDLLYAVDRWNRIQKVAISRDMGTTWTVIDLAERLGLHPIPPRAFS